MDTSGVGSTGRTTTTGWRGVIDRLGPQRAVPAIMFGGLTALTVVFCVVLTVALRRPPVSLLPFVLTFALMTVGSLVGPRDQPTVGSARRRELRRRIRRHEVRVEDAGDLESYRAVNHAVVRTMPWFLLASVPTAVSFHVQSEERLAEVLEFEAWVMRGLVVLLAVSAVVGTGLTVWRWRWLGRISGAMAELPPPAVR